MPTTFTLYSPFDPVLRFRLRDGGWIVGRSPTCDVVVDHPSVSRAHAELRVGASGVSVMDLGSRNGTYLSSLRIASGARMEIERGQEIRFGDVRFRLAVTGSAAAEGDETRKLPAR